MPRRQGIFRQVISGLVVLGLLLLSAASSSAMPTGHCPTGDDRSARIAWEVITYPACPDCPGDPCTEHRTAGDMCCAGAVCMLISIVPETTVFAPAAPTSVHYCNNMAVSIGLTPEPAVGPPISQG
jgi:hypothetical protein